MPNDVLRWGIEWHDQPVSRAEIARRKARAAKLGKKIVDEWLTAAKQGMARIDRLIQEDRALMEAETEREWLARDLKDSERAARKIADDLAPALKRAVEIETKRLRRDIKKFEEQIRNAGRRIAREKLARFKARRR